MMDSGIIPPWHLIKIQSLNKFYECIGNLEIFRKHVMSKKSFKEDAVMKDQLWYAFTSNLVSLYNMHKSIIRFNKGTSKYFEKLKVLENYQLDVSKLKYKEGIALFNILEEALHKIGLTNIGIKEEEDPENAIFR